MKKILALSFILVFTASHAFSQSITQTIKGKVIDKETLAPLIGATVLIPETKLGTVTDENGYFKITAVPVGRINLKVTYLGYKAVYLSNLDLTSGKELVMDLEMEEEIMEANEVVVTAQKDKVTANNEMATVSVRTFSVEEAERYAGARNDVSRMAANYAGVQGTNDAVNDIVIRGNSPYGLLWRLDGVDIPNPNHFGDFGSTGGPVSMLNSNLLSNSDFFTGAFPADYGNAMSGVFDLKLRNGNDEHHEFLGQIGLNGFELGAEGPLSKKNHSSYLVNARYSTLSLLSALGINFGTGTAIPYYQDLTFKLNFPSDKIGRITLFGLLGSSHIDLLAEDADEGGGNLYLDRRVNIYDKNRLAVGGISHTYLINATTYSKIILSYTYNFNGDDVDSLSTVDDAPHDFYNSNFKEGKFFASFYINKKISAKQVLRIGTYGTRSHFVVADSVYRASDNEFEIITSFKGGVTLIQPFAEWQFKPTNKLTFNTGIHALFLLYNNTYSVEPRFGVKYTLNKKQSLSLGYGLHGMMTTAYNYFKTSLADDGSLVYQNKDLDFMKSHQVVLGYDNNFSNTLRLKAEVYYQYLYDVIAESSPSSFSVINLGGILTSGTPDSLTNTGKGTNYGLELTFEKFLDKGFYFLLTSSLFESKYKGSDGVERNTAWNGHFVENFLVGKDFALNRNEAGTRSLKELTFDFRVVWAGGRLYSPVNVDASIAAGETEYYDDLAFSERFPNYFRADAKAGFRIHGKKITQEWAIDVQNVTNKQNPLYQRIDLSTGEVETVNQLGLFPIVQYRIEF